MKRLLVKLKYLFFMISLATTQIFGAPGSDSTGIVEFIYDDLLGLFAPILAGVSILVIGISFVIPDERGGSNIRKYGIRALIGFGFLSIAKTIVDLLVGTIT